jgi:type I restriction enzyme S subunit
MQIQKQKFKKTEMGEIPEEWSIVKIKDLSVINPESISKDYPHKEINYLEIGAINDYQIRNYGSYPISDKPSRAQRIIKRGDIVVSTVRPYLKGFALVNDERENLVCSTGFAVIRCNDKSDTIFLFNYIKSKLFEEQLFKQMEGMAYPAVTSSDVANVLLPYPNDHKERQYIGNILINVDNLIQKTSQVIELTQTLKKGLMQRLLPKGTIKPRDNKLVNDWYETKLGNLITLQRGHDLPNHLRQSGNIPVIGANGITGYHNTYKATGPGVLIGRSGTLGKVYFTPKNYWPLNTSLYVKQFNECDPLFIYYFLHSLDYDKYNAGSTVPTMNRNLLHPIIVTIPKSLKNQKKIASIFSHIDNLIQKLKDKKKSEEILKKGLMQQLLTGKLRVKI